MSLFGRWQDLTTFTSIQAVTGHFGVSNALWTAFSTSVGDFGDDLGILLTFPRTGLLAGLQKTTFPDGAGNSTTRRVVARNSGVLEAVAGTGRTTEGNETKFLNNRGQRESPQDGGSGGSK